MRLLIRARVGDQIAGYTQYTATGTRLVGRYKNSGTCARFSVCQSVTVCMWENYIKKFMVSL